jgi:hypothetical protein
MLMDNSVYPSKFTIQDYTVTKFYQPQSLTLKITVTKFY